MGTPAAAVPSLEAIARSRHVVAGVVTQPDRPGRRGSALVPPPVKEAAAALACPVLQPETLKGAEVRASLAALEPDVLAVVAYGRLLGPRLLAVAPHGAVNLHFSRLPRWRGAAPVQRAILAGDAVTGAAIIRLVQELDAGPVIASQDVAIEDGEHAPALESRLARVGAALLVDTLDALESGLAREQPQDESLVTLAPPLRPEEAWLDVAADAEALARRVRALDPWPGAKLRFARGVVSVLEAATGAGSGEPGTVLEPAGDDLPVACGRGVLLLRRVKPEGRGAMTGRSLVNGRFVSPGDRTRPS